jgi:hypothetical protein
MTNKNTNELKDKVMNNEFNSYKIISVEIVQGKELNSLWASNMQKVVTDKGTFVDNVTNPTHHSVPPGIDWISVIGKEVDNVYINHSKGYDWINKR